MKVRCAIAIAVSLLLGSFVVWADEKPDPSAPTPEAQALIGQVKAAYAQLSSLKASGKIQADLDVGGKVDNRATDFSSAYSAPGVYRHEIKDELLAGSTGEKVYVYEQKVNRFVTADAPKAEGSYRQLPGMLGQVLEVQNPSLLLAVSGNSVGDMVDGAKSVRTTDNTTLAGKSLPTLVFTAGDGRNVQLAFDAQSHLLRQATYDMAPVLRGRGAEQVNKATITIQYQDVQPNAKFADGFFIWAPPEGAREVSQTSDVMAISEGKPATDFALTDLEGKQVKLSSLKGNVVLLDFWATWCPPCVRSLPEIAAIYAAKKDGVRVFAVNVGEDKDTIKKFLDSKKIAVPVLMDADEKVSESYGVRGIPTTVVIKPNGTVAKVFVGIAPGGKAEIEHELELAAK